MVNLTHTHTHIHIHHVTVKDAIGRDYNNIKSSRYIILFTVMRGIELNYCIIPARAINAMPHSLS